MLRGVLVGCGGFGGAWAGTFLPRHRDRVQIVGVADPDPAVRDKAGATLGVPPEHRYATYDDLLREVEADACFIVVPPAIRPGVVRAAAARGMAILCEKPVAASWDDALEIGRIVRDAGIPFAVMQNYRAQARIVALKEVLARPELGSVHQIDCRFGANYTIDTAGGAFRHAIPDAFIYEGAEHHLDQFRNLAGSDAVWVQASQWGQPWSTFSGTTTLALIAQMANGMMITYQMSHVERGHQNGWHAEYYRVAAEGGTVVLDADDVIRIVRDIPAGEVVEEIRPVPQAHDGHHILIGQFLDWLEGGPAPFNIFDDNIRTMALTFGAVEATHTGGRVDVAAMLADGLDRLAAPRA